MDPKALLNALTAQGVNALLDAATREALLERMSDLPLGDDAAEVVVEPSPAEAAALAVAPTLRANVGRKVNPSTRMQAFVDFCCAHMGYGPLNGPAFVSDPTDADGNGCTGDIAVGGPWYANQKPMKGAVKPEGAWACSTAVNAILSAWLNAGPKFRRAGGAKIEKALALPSAQGGFLEYAHRLYDGAPCAWPHVLGHDCPERGSVNVALISFQNKKTGKWKLPSHVVLILDCDRLELTDPRTGERCRGLWRFGADGNFADVPSYEAVRDGAPGAYRSYSCKPHTFRPVAEDDSGRAFLYRVTDLQPDGTTPWLHNGVYHLNDICGLRLRLPA